MERCNNILPERQGAKAFFTRVKVLGRDSNHGLTLKSQKTFGRFLNIHVPDQVSLQKLKGGTEENMMESRKEKDDIHWTSSFGTC